MNSRPGTGKKGLGWIFKTLFILSLCATVIVTAFGGVVYWHFARSLPQIITAADYRPRTVTRILADGGKEESVIGEFYKERRYIVPIDKVPETVIRAFISAEDDQFFEHQGVNLVSILRASIANFRAGQVVQGGSTITQQVAKSLLLTPERSMVRKIKEVILAGRIERNLTKQQILYLYLNQIYLGHGAYGVQAAAKAYFGKDISEISLAEAALLAGMPQAPSKYSPHINPKKSKERQIYVLRRMYENNYISQAEMNEAAASPLSILADFVPKFDVAEYLVEQIRRELLEKYGEKAVYEEGLTVSVPASIELLRSAKKNLREGLEALDKRIGYRGPQKRIAKPDELADYLELSKRKFVKEELGFKILLPDGHLDIESAIEVARSRGENELLEIGRLYEAVVTELDHRGKAAKIQVGPVKGQIPLEEMKWAHPARDRRVESMAVSQILSKGDVIWVKVQRMENGVAIASLEQLPEVQGALMSLDVYTGNVLALEGGYDFAKSEFNRATQAKRQPGSSFKPFIYTAAIELGFTPTSLIVDSPVVYEEGDSIKWKPSNFEEKFYGDTTLRQALIKSRNVPTIKLVQTLEVSKLIGFVKRLGIDGQFNADLSISLGSGSISLWESVKGYAIFPRFGKKVKPILYSSIVDRDGIVLEENPPQGSANLDEIKLQPANLEALKNKKYVNGQPVPLEEGQVEPISLVSQSIPQSDPDQVLDPRVAYVMTHLMKEVVTHGTGAGAKELGRAAAAKTGTTNDYIDAWFIGFTPNVVSGVWVGFDNLKPLGPGETGARAALPIWLGFMQDAVKNHEETDFRVPPGIVFSTIDVGTGKLAATNSKRAIIEAFIEGTEPKEAVAESAPSAQTQSEFFKEDIE